MERETLIRLARDLGKSIQESDIFKAYAAAKEKADSDEHLQNLIGEFNLKRVDLSNAVNGGETDHDKIDQLDMQLKGLYDEVMSNEVMMAYNTTKVELDKTFNFMSQILAAAVNGNDPELVEESDCTGSCSSCSGCH